MTRAKGRQPMKLLIVEDDLKGAHILKRGLEEEAFTVDVVGDGAAAEAAVASADYDLIVLDWMLPGKPGLEICRDLRLKQVTVPILMLTAKDALEDRVAGLNTGADDYVTKPFAFWELVARIRALIRRARSARPPLVRLADLVVDPVSHDVSRGGRRVDLTATEYAVLDVLVQHAGRVVTRAQLTQRVWGASPADAANLVEVYVSRLRKKLDDGEAVPLLQTVRGRGYCLRGDAS
jgi:DNA-binding response OmpR family regulator